MKKVVSLLLAVMILLCLSACGGNDSTTDNDNGSFTNQTQTNVTDSSSAEQNADSPTSATTTKPETSKPSTTTKPEASKPSSTTKPETTKPTTPTHTHNYSKATCTEPAKCSCGATNGSALGHSYSNGVCSRCGGKDSNYVKTYYVGETWVVDGQWEFTVNSVTTHYLCNSTSNKYEGYTNEQVILIDYTYKNLGYTNSIQDLFFSSLSFDLYDGTGETSEIYACTHEKYSKPCIVGAKCNATQSYVLFNNSSKITFVVEHNTSNGAGKAKAKFVLNVN